MSLGLAMSGHYMTSASFACAYALATSKLDAAEEVGTDVARDLFPFVQEADLCREPSAGEEAEVFRKPPTKARSQLRLGEVLVKREFESRRSGTWQRALPFDEPCQPSLGRASRFPSD